MSVTPDQLLEAAKAAQRMKTALDAHLSVLDAKAKRLAAEGRQIPSANSFFLYVADKNGVIKLQQDAEFIVESVLVVNPPFGILSLTRSPLFYELSLKDANAGRDLTGGFHPRYADNPVTSEDTNFVPGLQFVPINGTPVDQYFAPNVDDWKTVKTEYILPRGGVVRAEFRSTGATAVGIPGIPLPDVILSGYKMF